MARPLQSDGRLHGVIVGCRRDDGRWLLVRRAGHLAMAPRKVCFPGGAVEPDEPQPQAVVREMHEELGVVVEPVRCVWHRVYPDKTLTLWGWLAQLPSYNLTPDPGEIAEVLWLTRAEIIQHPDGLPYTDEFLAALLRACDA